MPLIGFRKHVMETREPLLIEETRPEGRSVRQPGSAERRAEKSALFVPLVAGGGATGVVSLQNVDREHAFGERTSGS